MKTTKEYTMEMIKELAEGYARNGSNPDWESFHQLLRILAPQEKVIFIDEETGEITNGEGLIITNEKVQYAKTCFHKKRNELLTQTGIDKRGHWVRVFTEYHQQFEGKLTNGQRTKIMKLIPYTQYNGEPFIKDGEVMSTEQIGELWGINSLRSVQYEIKALEEIGILKKKRIKGNKYVYWFTEEEIWMGKSDSEKRFIKMYIEKLKEVIERIEKIEKTNEKRRRKKKKTSALGVLHAIIPYFHFQTYYLVTNPTENVVKPGETIKDVYERDKASKRRHLKHLSRAKLGELALKGKEYDPELDIEDEKKKRRLKLNIVNDHLKTLQNAGALMSMNTRNTTRTIIHPHLLFSSNANGEDDYTTFILYLFSQH